MQIINKIIYKLMPLYINWRFCTLSYAGLQQMCFCCLLFAGTQSVKSNPF